LRSANTTLPLRLPGPRQRFRPGHHRVRRKLCQQVARHYDALAAAARSGRIEVVQEPTRGRVSPGAQPVQRAGQQSCFVCAT